MKKITLILLFCSFFIAQFSSQTRPVNKLTLQSCYSYSQIHQSLRDVVDQADRSSYFDDSFFNTLLRKIVTDKKFTEEEKAKLFYLMQKKLGFSFVGINYLPPKQNYFNFFMGEAVTWQKTSQVLKDLKYDVGGLIALVSQSQKSDAVLASNALLLATILRPDSAQKKLEEFSRKEVIFAAANPEIFNHYVCLSAAIVHDEAVTAALAKNVMDLKKEAMTEDAICALYVKNNPVGTIKEYILQEQNPENGLAIETALCALQNKVPQATFQKSLKSFTDESKEKWKKELLKKLATNKVPYNYSLTDKEQVVNKIWDGVTLSLYTDGVLITSGNLLEFDPN